MSWVCLEVRCDRVEGQNRPVQSQAGYPSAISQWSFRLRRGLQNGRVFGKPVKLPHIEEEFRPVSGLEQGLEGVSCLPAVAVAVAVSLR